jgi:putative transposase
MPRANRHYVPGHVWRMTHRCHKQEFVLKFAKDRHHWLQLLFEAKRRYTLVILDWMVTSNHMHLLVLDAPGRDLIPKSIQLIASRTAQDYSKRKRRKGAFWQDRSLATAVETGRRVRQRPVYIDLNMVRAGVEEHPAECAFRWIQSNTENEVNDEDIICI